MSRTRRRPITAPKNALEQQMRQEIGCICGTCAHEPLTKCTCGTAQQDARRALRDQIDQGKTHDEIIQAFIGIYGGQHFLGAPLDEGFNRLAWLVPYLLAATGAVGLGFVALRMVAPACVGPGRIRARRRSRPRSSASTMSSATSTERSG